MIKTKIEAMGIPLKEWDVNIYRGILTGYNEAFIIDQDTRNRLIEASAKNDEIIRPILRGRNIEKYSKNYDNQWLIFTRRGIEIDNYSAIKEHLMKYYDYIKPKTGNDVIGRKPGSYNWYEIQDNIAYHEDFKKPKLIYPNMTKFMPFYLDDDGYLLNDKCFMIIGKHIEYLTAFFNSSIFKFCFINNFPELQGGTRELRKIFFDIIPVKPIDDNRNSIFAQKIKEIQEFKRLNQDTIKLEKDIDELLFDFYHLTKEEREVIGFIKL